ncbi:MAG: PAS domain S-box protein [Candidatus Kariarchaeaceae archaeon]|jgi:PAS domain S-box-containing protein
MKVEGSDEQALTNLEDYYRTYAESSMDPILIFDVENYKNVKVNDAYCKYMKLSRQTILEGTIGEPPLAPELQPDTKKLSAAKVTEVGKKAIMHGSATVTWYNYDGDGNLRVHTVNITNIPIKNQKLVRCLFIDITEQSKLEEKFLASEERFRSLFEMNPVSIWEEDFSEVLKYLESLNFREIPNFSEYLKNNPNIVQECFRKVIVKNVNQKTIQLLGVDHKDDLLGNLERFSTEDIKNDFINELVAIREGKTSVSFETTTITLSGEILDIMLYWHVIPGYESTLNRVLVSIVDITEKNKAEIALSESEEKFRTLFENSPLPSIVADLSFAKKELDRLKIYSGNQLIEFSKNNPNFIIDLIEHNNAEVVNQQYLDLFGYVNLQEAQDDTFDKPISEDTLQSWISTFAAWLDGNLFHYAEITLYHVDKSERNLVVFRRLLQRSQQSWSSVIILLLDQTKEKKVEIALRSNEQRYRTLFNNAQVGIFQTKIDGSGLIEINDKLCEISGYSRKELIGIPVDFLWKNNSQRDDLVDTLQKEGKVSNVEITLIRKDGHELPLLANIDIYPKEGIVEGALLDITEKKSAENALKESEQRYRTLVEEIPNLVIIFDKNGIIKYANSAHPLRKKEDLVDKKATVFFDKKNSLLLKESITKALNNNEAVEGEFQSSTGNYYVTRFFALSNEEVIAISLDITDRKKIEEKLIESEQRYKGIVETQSEFIVRWLPDGIRTFVNDAYCKYFGLTKEEAIGTSFFQEISGEYGEIMKARLNKITPENPVSVEEHEVIRADGSRGWNIWTDRGLFDEKGNITEYQSVGLDISERKNAEEELQRTKEQLTQSTKLEAIGRLAGGVAHDFNNILTGILGYSEIMSQLIPKDSELHDYVDEITKASNRSASLVKQLLTFSRKQIIEPRILNLNDIVKDTHKMLGRVLGEDIEFEIVLDEDLANISADPTQINQILMNLAVNARDAMPEGGILKIKSENLRYTDQMSEVEGLLPMVVLTVSDTGIGMDKATLDHLFEPFFTTKSYGTGLGLATIYGIIKQNNGDISVESKLGKGTTFKIYLPATSRQVKDDAIGETSFITKSDKSVLLVEDDSTVSKLVTKILENTGYTVVSANKPSSALEILEKKTDPFDLIISDIILPEMNGLEFVKKIQETGERSKVLFITGYVDQPLYDSIKVKGFLILEKPFTPHELLTTIEDLIR